MDNKEQTPPSKSCPLKILAGVNNVPTKLVPGGVSSQQQPVVITFACDGVGCMWYSEAKKDCRIPSGLEALGSVLGGTGIKS